MLFKIYWVRGLYEKGKRFSILAQRGRAIYPVDGQPPPLRKGWGQNCQVTQRYRVGVWNFERRVRYESALHLDATVNLCSFFFISRFAFSEPP